MNAFLSLFSGGLVGYLISAAVAALLSIGVTATVVHKMDNSTLESYQLADQKAQTIAIGLAESRQKKQDDANLNAAVKEAEAQQKIVTQTVTLTKEVTVHVPQINACVPNGLVSMLNAAALGTDVADSGSAPSKLDESCSSVPWDSLAADLIDDYGTGRQNAEQLNALEADVTSIISAANGTAK